ncbi:tRNA (cytidine(34)-2'-O)-methyltransferase [bacterium]|nr:tRNA (cytidine(34)-2'-O)-methyltransferase [bacterium]
MNHIVLFEPEIPQNTGNIMRTCIATNSTLHLIKPLGFSLDDKEIKRSSVNYTHNFSYYLYNSFSEFESKNKNGIFIFLTRYGLKKHTDLDYSDTSKDYYFILGKESTGIPLSILNKHIDNAIRIPMSENVRALNVSNACAIIIYEALRQQNYPDLSIYEPETFKGKNHILDSHEEN